MEYVNLDAQIVAFEGCWTPSRYLEQLPLICGDLPPGPRSFATDTDHYDSRSRRCVTHLTLRAVRGADGGGGGGFPAQLLQARFHVDPPTRTEERTSRL